MVDTGQHWELFGYDMRQLGKHWLAAWRSFLWGEDSPLRERLDDVVCLYDESSSTLYQAGKPCADSSYKCEAVLLPNDLVLTRTFDLPAAAENELDAVLGIEVNASSPFSSDDTGYGWQVLARADSHLRMGMAIVSRGAVMAYLGRQYDLHQADAREVWADVDGVKVVVRGFGETRREASFRQRLVRCSALVALGGVLVIALLAVATGAKWLELSQVEKIAVSTQERAAEASEMRSALALANQNISAANKVITGYPSPHYEIARLTQLLGDDAHILQFTMNGREIRLRGRAVDASSVMQILTSEPDFQEVTAPQAIVKVAKSGLEQFSLNVTLAAEMSP